MVSRSIHSAFRCGIALKALAVIVCALIGCEDDSPHDTLLAIANNQSDVSFTKVRLIGQQRIITVDDPTIVAVLEIAFRSKTNVQPPMPWSFGWTYECEITLSSGDVAKCGVNAAHPESYWVVWLQERPEDVWAEPREYYLTFSRDDVEVLEHLVELMRIPNEEVDPASYDDGQLVVEWEEDSSAAGSH